MPLHDRQRPLGILRVYKRDIAPLVGHVQRIKSEKLASPAHGNIYGDRIFFAFNRTPRRTGNLVEYRRKTTPRGIPEAMNAQPVLQQRQYGR